MPSKTWEELLNDAEQEGGATSYEPIPANTYDFTVTGSEAKKTQKGKDMYKITCKVENGPHEGRLVWHNFVVSPESPKAMAMFFRNLNTLGLNRENFFSQNPSNEQVAGALLNRRFRGQVSIRHDDNYGDSNEIKNFATPVGPVAAQSGVPSTPTPATAPQVAPNTPEAPPAAPAAPPAPPAAPQQEAPAQPPAVPAQVHNNVPPPPPSF